MKANSKNNKERKDLVGVYSLTSKNLIKEKFRKIPFNRIAKESGFCKRKARKITPKEFLIGFILMIFSNDKNSYRNWAIKIGQIKKTTLSKQSLWKRMHEGQIEFLEKVLKLTMQQKISQPETIKKPKGLSQFRNVLLEDSTHIKLNDELSEYYPGNGYQENKEKKSIIKIQTVYNLLKSRFEKLEITSFRKNDQSVSEEIFSIAKRGDLLIRDLGYFVLKSFKKLNEKKVYFISRMKNGINIKSKDTEAPIDLAKMLKKRGTLDLEVLLGEKEKLPVRIIAIPLEESVASARRRKAKSNRDQRSKPSKKRLFLLGWEIFITNVNLNKLTSQEIAEIYGIRWQIEIIFKSWKSYFKIAETPREANIIRVKSYIYCMLIFITIFQTNYLRYYSNYSFSKSERISLLKLSQFIAGNMILLLQSEYMLKSLTENTVDKLIRYYCVYESRIDRSNFIQKIISLS